MKSSPEIPGQVVNGGRLTGSYLSSWNNELQLTVTGGHEFSVKIGEEELRDLASRLNERIESIDVEREEKIQTEIKAREEELAALDNEETNG